MTELFNNKILCGKCDIAMDPIKIHRNGFLLRAVKCSTCNNRIVHPKDEQEYRDFSSLKKKQYNVKMRFVGNSYAVSIPKEIVEFMKEQEKVMDEMVKLSFEELGRISLVFGCNTCNIKDSPNNSNNSNNLNTLKNEDLN